MYEATSNSKATSHQQQERSATITTVITASSAHYLQYYIIMMKMTRATKRRWKEWGFDEKQDQDHQQMAKRRKERWERNHPPFEMILVAILPKIFSYLDNVNEVFHLSTLCKSFRLVIKDAPEIVVHAAGTYVHNRTT